MDDVCCCLGMARMVKRVLNDAGVTKDDVHKVVLVGGSTRIPGVRRSLARRFGAKKVSSGVNPDEAVAIGAAIQAGVLAGQSPSLSNGPRPGAGVEGFSSGLDGSGLVLLDVTPLSLGIASASGLLSVVVPRNTVIPAKASRVYTTDADNQGNIFVEVYQGERAMAKDNALLGSFLLDDIPPAPRHVPQIEVTFRLDVDGMLSVVAEDQATGVCAHCACKLEGNCSRTEIHVLLAPALALLATLLLGAPVWAGPGSGSGPQVTRIPSSFAVTPGLQMTTFEGCAAQQSGSQTKTTQSGVGCVQCGPARLTQPTS